MKIAENVPLSELTTFKVGGPARFVVDIEERADIARAVSFAREKRLPLIVLGGGSNILSSDEGARAVILRIRTRGVSRVDRDDEVLVTVEAGEAWDALVAFAVAQGLWGIENLSGIPGSVGAAPIQNIGAYGAELADALVSVEALDISTGEIKEIPAQQCELSYRSSMFKKEHGKGYVILSVTLRLTKKGTPRISYKDLRARFGEEVPDLPAIREAVLSIRARKFPDLSKEGTAGSFFKNPLVTPEEAARLLSLFPTMPQFEEGARVKIPLAWILDTILHLKGEKRGSVRAYEAQPLVLVAESGASAREVRAFAREIAARVHRETGIMIEPEVCIMDDGVLAHRL